MKINIAECTEKFNSVHRRKVGVLISTTIQDDLLEEEWKTRLEEIEETSNFEDSKGYNQYSKQIIKLFDDLCTSIMAPGVDRLIRWMTQDLGLKDASRLKHNFVNSFSGLSEYIEIILSSVLNLPVKEQSIFKGVCEHIEAKLKILCEELISIKDNFEESARPLLEEISLILQQYSSIVELKFTNISQFFENEKDDYYTPYIELMVKNSQARLCFIEESNDEFQISDLLHRLIKDIRGSIDLLDRSMVSNYEEDFLRLLFVRKKSVVFKEDDSFKTCLEEFLENKWNKILLQYRNIAQHITSSESLLKLTNDRKNFILFPQINKAIDSYFELKDPLEFHGFDPKSRDIENRLEALDSSINYMRKQCINVMKSIKSEFRKHHESYRNNLKTLENLARNFNSEDLTHKIKDLKEQLDGLNRIIGGISDDINLIHYVASDIEEHLVTYTLIQTLFEEALQMTGLGEHLNWLDAKMGEEKTKELQVEDLCDLNFIQELLNRKLIKVTIEKQYQ